jgi:hypothetical protein
LRSDIGESDHNKAAFRRGERRRYPLWQTPADRGMIIAEALNSTAAT